MTSQAKNQEYNGWSNHATWVVNLWITNTYSAYLSLQEILTDKGILKTTEAKADQLKDMVVSNIAKNVDKKLNSRGENWGVGIRQDFRENESAEDVNWIEIIESNIEG